MINLFWERYHCTQWDSLLYDAEYYMMWPCFWLSQKKDWDLNRAGRLPLSLHVLRIGARLEVKLFLKDIHLSSILMTSFHFIPIRGFSTQSAPPVTAELESLNLFESLSDAKLFCCNPVPDVSFPGTLSTISSCMTDHLGDTNQFKSASVH